MIYSWIPKCIKGKAADIPKPPNIKDLALRYSLVWIKSYKLIKKTLRHVAPLIIKYII